jgi:hypothetical protein
MSFQDRKVLGEAQTSLPDDRPVAVLALVGDPGDDGALLLIDGANGASR